jgi:hypothetical protein
MTTENETAFDDFNLDTDVVETPLVPNGNYSGNVTQVTVDHEKHAIIWKVVLANNDGCIMSDGEHDVDGEVLFFRNWLPKPGDDIELTSSGKMTKKQSKLSQLQKFVKAMHLDVVTMSDIQRKVDEADWIGLEVVAAVAIREWQGSFSNEITKMTAWK